MMMENLAPAGNREALDRAVAAGADAVYLGYAAFSARAGAGNFDEAQLREAVHFAHLHHVAVHVTVNTLIKEGEMAGLLDVLRLLNEVKVDAVLVQDLGVLHLARTCFPDLPVHASTQMAIHNASGVAWCKKMGMTRAVLARECSLSEIRKAADVGRSKVGTAVPTSEVSLLAMTERSQRTPACMGEMAEVEVEVFGHGAQCVAVSGQCLFSSMIGGRSGNRGRCAQPCRLEYTYRGKTAAWLSPRDVCMRDHLPELFKAGACSIKIEGRLKRPEYVATVAGSYRQAIDAMARGEFAKADAWEQDSLVQIFSRGGLMKGYAMGSQDAGVVFPDRVNHGGVPIGQIEAVAGGMARVRLNRDLNDGDGLQIRTGRGDQEMIYSGHDTPAGSIAVLRLRPDMRIKAGDEVFRLVSSVQLDAARALAIPAIPCDLTLVAYPGEPLSLTATDGTSTVTVTGDIVSEAQKRALSEEDARKSLGKMGDTPFALRDCIVFTENAFVPVSTLNAIRRDALIALENQRAGDFARQTARECHLDALELPKGSVPETVIFRDMAQYEAVRSLDARLVWYPEDFREDAMESGLSRLDAGVWLHLPVKCEQDTLEMLHRFVIAHADKLGGVVLGNVGQLGLTWPVPYGAGEGVPVTNRRAMQTLFGEGCEFVTASGELSAAELSTLLAGGAPMLVPAYGRAQLMLLHHCPARTYLGLSKGHAACRMCDDGAKDALAGTSFTDRRGAAFPLLRQRLPEGCLVRLMNGLPTDLVERVRHARYVPLMTLTDESGDALDDALRVWRGGKGRGEATSAHWNRPVE